MNRNIRTHITRVEARMERFTQARNLEFGIGVPADPAEACAIYRSLYEKEWTRKLELILKEFPMDYWESLTPEEAIRYVEEAAKRRYDWAMVLLARCYEQGECVQQDAVEAARLYRLAVDMGIGEAQYRLGCMYAEGRGVPRNTPEAMRLFSYAAEQSGKYVLYRMARCYDEGAEDFPADAAMAARCYRRALLVRYSYLQDCVPCFSGRRTGKEAVDLYLPELARDNRSAVLGYARCCELGDGVCKNLAEALKWHRVAAEWGVWHWGAYQAEPIFDFLQRHPDIESDETEKARRCLNNAWGGRGKAKYAIARRYEFGIGVPCDLHLAAYWYKRCSRGYDAVPSAGLALERVARRIGRDAIPGDYVFSLKVFFLRQRAQAGDAHAAKLLEHWWRA